MNATTEYGETPLHLAIQYHHRTTAEVLIAHGADVNAQTKERQTPLDFAYRTAPELVDLLRAAGGQEGKELRK